MLYRSLYPLPFHVLEIEDPQRQARREWRTAGEAGLGVVVEQVPVMW